MVFMFGEAKASGCCAAVLPRKVSLRGRARPAAGSALRFCCWGFCSINPLRAYGVLVPRDPGGAGAAALTLPTSIPRGGAEHPSLCWGLASKQGDKITLLPSPAGHSGDAQHRVERMEGRQSAAILRGSGGVGPGVSAPSSPPPAANLPGGTVQSAGQPRQQPGGAGGGRPADQELSHLQGPRHQGSVPAAMARHRRQRPQGGQELRESFLFFPPCLVLSPLDSLGFDALLALCPRFLAAPSFSRQQRRLAVLPCSAVICGSNGVKTRQV